MNSQNQGLQCPSFFNKTNRKPFSVMVKPIGSLCNLNCRYCYYHQKDQQLNIKNYLMDDDTLQLFIQQYLQAHPGKVVSFVWHGGEPLLAGIDFYQKVVQYQKLYQPKGYQIWNNIQTNGTLLNEQWAQFLSENHFDVGLSIDGTKAIHDYYRGEGTYDAIVKNCQLLKKYGIKADLLCTVTKDTASNPLQVYNSLKNLNTGWMQFIPIVIFNGDSLSQESVTAEEYGQFLITIFDYWLKNDLATVGVQLFAETMMMLMGQPSSLCTLSENCGTALVVEHDGSVYSCDHYVDLKYCLGNIKSTHLGDMAFSDCQLKFGLEKSQLHEKCNNCSVNYLCHGGCKKDRREHLNVLCQGYEMFFKHVEAPLKEVISLLRQRKSFPEIQKLINNKY